MATDLIGWAAAVALLATLGRQIYTQWRSGMSAGVSRWLFAGQLSASTGFVVYSWLRASWVFDATNALILVTALSGQWIYWRNERERRRTPPPGRSSARR